jgi:hypothetical protein
MFEWNALYFIYSCIQVHLLVFLKEIIHLLNTLNMEHKKQNIMYFPKHSAIELHVTILGAEQQIITLRAPGSSTYEYKRRKGRNLEAESKQRKN